MSSCDLVASVRCCISDCCVMQLNAMLLARAGSRIGGSRQRTWPSESPTYDTTTTR